MEEFISQLLSSVKGIWKYRWLAVLVMWLVAIAGSVRVLTLPDSFQSTARVFVDTQTVLKPLLAGMTSVPNVEQQVSIMSRTLLSRPNLERVMRMVDLDIGSASPRAHEQQLEQLMLQIKIEGTRSNDIYTITYRHHDPKTARDVVQALLSIFVEGSFKGKKGDSAKAVQFLEEQIKGYEERLVAAENSVKEFKVRNAALLPRQGVDYSAQLAIASDALGTARLDLLEAQQARAAIAAQVKGDAPLPVDTVRTPAAANPELDARIAALQKNLDLLRMQYTEQHPDIVAAHRLIAQLEARKREEAKNQAQDFDPGKNYSPMLQQLKVALTEADAKVAAMGARVQEYKARHDRLVAQSNAVPEVEAQLAQLNRDYQVNKDNYEKLIGRREAAKLSGDLSNTTEMMTFKIIDPPTQPLAPVGPNRTLYHSLVMLAALVAGPGAALLLSQVRPTFLSPGMMREITGLTVLGTVSMNWTAAQKIRRRREQALFGVAGGALLLAYGAMLAAALAKG